MSDYVRADRSHETDAPSTISVMWVILSALVLGLGLFTVTYWLLTQNWLYFAGVLPTVVGGLMLFSPRAGWDHA